MKESSRLRSAITVVASAFFAAMIAPSAFAQSSFGPFKPDDYADITARKKLPPPVKGSALAAARLYIEAQRLADLAKTELVVLQDTPNKRVYRYVLV